MQFGDVLSVYGPRQRLEELDLRKQGFEGDRAHQIAIQQKAETELNPPDSSSDGSRKNEPY